MSVYSGQSGSAGVPSKYAGSEPWHRWQDWINLILGIWLFIAPWAMHLTGTGSSSVMNFWVLGVIVVVFALCALATPEASWPEWVNTIAGIWLFVSPWALGFAATMHQAATNTWIVGVVVAILSIWAGAEASGRKPATTT